MTWRIIASFPFELVSEKLLSSQVQSRIVEDHYGLFIFVSIEQIDWMLEVIDGIELHKEIKGVSAVKCWLISTAKTLQFASVFLSSLNSHPVLEREEVRFIFSLFDLRCHWHVGSEMNLKLSWPQTSSNTQWCCEKEKKNPLMPLGRWSSSFHRHLRRLFLFKDSFFYLICLLKKISSVSILTAV